MDRAERIKEHYEEMNMNEAHNGWWTTLWMVLKPPVKNADNKWLGPMGEVGRVTEVNGAGAQEFCDFHPTKHELITLAKYWAETAIDIEFGWFLYDGADSAEIRLHPFAWKRMKRIRALIGREVDDAIEQAYQDYGAKQDKEAWEVFRHGSKAQRAALREEIQGKIRDGNGD
jgi:hypothetical protein